MKVVFGKRAIRSFNVMLVACMLVVSTLGNQAFAADQPQDHTEASNSFSWTSGTNKYSVYASSSTGFMGAEWSDSRKVWAFNYRFVGTAAGRLKQTSGANPGTYSSNQVKVAAMDVNGTSNTSNMSIWTNASSTYIGSAPASSGTNSGYSPLMSAIAGFAITAINNLSAAYIWSAVGLADAMRNVAPTSSTTATSLMRSWNWTGQSSDVGQYLWFIVDVKPNQTVQISTEYYVLGADYELLEAGIKYRNLTAGAAKTTLAAAKSTESTDNWNPGMMSEKDKKKFGIEEISREQFDKRAEELNISERSIKEFKNSNEEVFYYAHNFEEYEISPSEPVNPKDALIQKIDTQIERSKKIVNAYSSLEDLNEEDQKIIQKHKERELELNQQLEKAQLLDKNDSTKINAQIKELESQL